MLNYTLGILRRTQSRKKAMNTKAFREGIMAAFSRILPTCPYCKLYQPLEYKQWYDGLEYAVKNMVNRNSFGETHDNAKNSTS